MGQKKMRLKVVKAEAPEVMAVDTLGGRIQVNWDQTSQATPNGQLVFLAEFLQATGLYQAWFQSCPLVYTSGNAFNLTDILGTWLLAILSGHKRYAHITTPTAGRFKRSCSGDFSYSRRLNQPLPDGGCCLCLIH